MDKIRELREKRAKVWEEAKTFLEKSRNASGLLSAVDQAIYDKMTSDVDAYGIEIARLEKQAEVDRFIDEENIKLAKAKYSSDFWQTMRKNNYHIGNANALGKSDEGRYLATDELEEKIIDGLRKENIIREIATIVKSATMERKIPVYTSHGSAAWLDELEEVPLSEDKFKRIVLGSYRQGTMIKISEELMHDSAFDLESFFAKEFARRFGELEEEAFLIGDGDKKPVGLLSQCDITETAGPTITADDVIDLYYSLDEAYRRNGTFIVNDETVKEIRKMKDANGRYIWMPGTDGADTIFGKPYKTSKFMPTIAPNAKVLAFGDFSYYWIAERCGRSFLRLGELYSRNGQIAIIGVQRVDGKLTLPEAVKSLKIKE